MSIWTDLANALGKAINSYTQIKLIETLEKKEREEAEKEESHQEP